jgi:hypothetical protein
MTQYGGNDYFSDILASSASATHADQLEAFVKARLPQGALANAQRAADEIRTRSKVKARLLPQLESALSAR